MPGCLQHQKQTSAASMEIQSVVSFYQRRWNLKILDCPAIRRLVQCWPEMDKRHASSVKHVCQWASDLLSDLKDRVCSCLQRSVCMSRRWSSCPPCCWPASWSLWSSFSCCVFVRRKLIESVHMPQRRPTGECCMALMVRHQKHHCWFKSVKSYQKNYTGSTQTASCFSMYI